MVNVATVDLYNINCTGTVYMECKIAYWLWRTVPFVLFTIGMLGNILNFVVLSRQRMRKYSTTVYLLFLAGTDMVFLLFGLLPDTVYSVTSIRFEDYSEFFCRTRPWVVFTSGAFSVWLLVLITLERVLLTKAPIVTRAKLTPRTSFVVSTAVLVLLALANVHCITGFKHHLNKTEIETEFGNELLHFPCTFASREYMEFFTGTWGLMILIVFNILPATIILIGNALVALNIIKRKRRLNTVHPLSQNLSATQVRTVTSECLNNPKHRDVQSDMWSHRNREQSNDKQKTNVIAEPDNVRPTKTEFKRITQHIEQPDTFSRLNITRFVAKTTNVKKPRSPARMLFTLTIVFMVSTSPYAFYVMVKARLNDLNEKEVARWQLLTVVVLICAWCNFTFNFFLYFVSGTLFKQEWKRLVKKGKVKFRSMFD